MPYVKIETAEQEQARIEREYAAWARAFRIATGQLHSEVNGK